MPYVISYLCRILALHPFQSGLSKSFRKNHPTNSLSPIHAMGRNDMRNPTSKSYRKAQKTCKSGHENRAGPSAILLYRG